jgi:hypothetical protein
MSTFVVSSASYNASPPSWPKGSSNGPDDPVVFVQGTVDGVYSNVWLQWSAIQTANIAGGVAAVQSLIAYWFRAYVSVQPKFFANQPQFPVANSIPAPITGNGTSTTCQAAMVGTWTA